jgi:flagellar assembly protein FliH
MSSSPSRAPFSPAPASPVAKDTTEALPFPYREVAGSQNGFPRAESPAGRGESATDQTAVMQAREAGRQQGEGELRTKFEEQLGGERAAIAKAVTDFASERAAYYGKIEEEAVRLALSIARKVLHREAQVDPVLLMGITRVVLERMAGATEVSLRVHPSKASAWRDYMAAHLPAGQLPEIVEEAASGLEQCELRTSMGTAVLGLELELKEIEQGLTDLLAARPQAKP